MYQFTDNELRKLQLKNLELVQYFKTICEENNLLFYFCGGCCIGALRHKGFIPWDDDIDIFMPRRDYEALKKVWAEKADTKRYSILYANEKMVHHNIFITISDNQTTFIRPHQQELDIPHGIVLDILPLDGCPSKWVQRKIQMIFALLYSLYCAQVVPENHGTIVKYTSKFLLKLVPCSRIRYMIWRLAERQMSRYVIDSCDFITELCAGPGYIKNKYPAQAFKEAVYKEFEGDYMPLPIGYHDYLSIAFGNYMELPPKEKLIAHHDAIFCDLDNSYEKYKGKYYYIKGVEK